MFLQPLIRRQNLRAIVKVSNHAGIYTKGTDLDPKNHDKERAEQDLLIQYYENYLKSEGADPAELEKVRDKYNQLIS